MAASQKVSPATVERIWKKHKPQPHRVENFKFSNDPEFASKVRDIVGLYLNPPDKAVLLSVDEKSRIQALDRTCPRGGACDPGHPRSKIVFTDIDRGDIVSSIFRGGQMAT